MESTFGYEIINPGINKHPITTGPTRQIQHSISQQFKSSTSNDFQQNTAIRNQTILNNNKDNNNNINNSSNNNTGDTKNKQSSRQQQSDFNMFKMGAQLEYDIATCLVASGGDNKKASHKKEYAMKLFSMQQLKHNVDLVIHSYIEKVKFF